MIGGARGMHLAGSTAMGATIKLVCLLLLLCSSSLTKPWTPALVSAAEEASIGLTWMQMNSILASEAMNEFTSEEEWRLASQVEWKLAGARQDTTNSKSPRRRLGQQQRRGQRQLDTNATTTMPIQELPSPFVVCHLEPGKSGHAKSVDIQNHFLSLGDNGGPVELLPLNNGVNMTCFYLSTTATVAATLQPPMVIHPVVPQVKLEHGILEYIEQSTTTSASSNSEGLPTHLLSPPSRFNAIFCPGFVSPQDDEAAALQLANLIINNIRADAQELQESGSDGSRRRRHHRHRHQRYRQLLESDNAIDDDDGEEDEEENHRPLERELEDTLSTAACGDMLLGITVAVAGDVMVIDLDDSSTYSKGCLSSLVVALSQVRQICTVEVSPEKWPMNTQAQWITQSGQTGYRPWFDVGLTGKGQVVAVSDTGLDDSSCYLYDPAAETSSTPRTDLFNSTVYPSRRKVIQYVDYADGSDSSMGHGTHVVGTIVGRPVLPSSSSTTTTADGDGIAPDAKVAFVDIGKGKEYGDDDDREGPRRLFLPPTVSELLAPGRKAGAAIHAAAWGSPFSNSYGAEERQVDANAFQHVHELLVVAAGNSGAINSPATAKNVLSVGSSQSEGSMDLTWGMPGKDYLSWFSSRGPTRDGRHKPEVVAPGERLTSAAAAASSSGKSGHCETHTLAGTSMATAVVAGSAALVRQYYQEGYYPSGKATEADQRNPSAALLKATLMNGAVPLQGVDTWWWGTEGLEEYDMAQNFGRVHLQNSLPLAGKNEIQAQVVDRQVIADGQVQEYSVTLSDNSSCLRQQHDGDVLRATLVWTDPPATALCKECVLNDLDLLVVGPKTIYFANGRDDPDRKNNAERIRVQDSDDARPGNVFTIQVVAANLLTPTQEYALVITGCLEPMDPPNTESENNDDPGAKEEASAGQGNDENLQETTSLPSTHSLDPGSAGNVQNGPSIPTPSTSSSSLSAAAVKKRVLSTGFDKGPQAFYGIMFHVVAHTNVRIVGLDIVTYYPWNVVLDHSFDLQVWSMEGDFSTRGAHTNHSQWTQLLHLEKVRGMGTGNATALPNFDTPLDMTAQTKHSFYLSMPHADLAMTSGLSQNLPFGSVVASHADELDILSGIALEQNFGNWYADYIFNGAIHYEVLP